MHLAETVHTRCRLAVMFVLVASLAGVVGMRRASSHSDDPVHHDRALPKLGQCVNGHWR